MADVRTNRADKKAVIVHTTDPKTGQSKTYTKKTSAGEIKVESRKMNIRDIIKETVLPPRSPDERRFWQKHVNNVQITDYPNAVPNQFNPTTAQQPRLADYYGDSENMEADLELDPLEDYEEDDDEEVYEAVDPENFASDIVNTTVDTQRGYRGLGSDDDDDEDDDEDPDNNDGTPPGYDLGEEMTDAQMKKREEIVKAMKKKGFKGYGKRNKEVMYRTATKLAQEETQLEENFKPGKLKLKDGSSVNVSSKDAMALNSLFVHLTDANQSKMDQKLMADKKGYNEVLSFAKEV